MEGYGLVHRSKKTKEQVKKRKAASATTELRKLRWLLERRLREVSQLQGQGQVWGTRHQEAKMHRASVFQHGKFFTGLLQSLNLC